MNTNSSELLEKWQAAMKLKSSKRWSEASPLIVEVLKAEPSWEHGYGYFNLAECYEESGLIEEAGTAYRLACKCSSTDRTLLGALASFLYQYGLAKEAFDVYVRLIFLDRLCGDTAAEEVAMMALENLAGRLGWPEGEVQARIEQRALEFTSVAH